jgi:hypothetical protein
MIKLDETELKLKEDIDIIFSGGYDDKFSTEQIEFIKQLSFLYNHIDIEDSSIVFKYDNVKFQIIGFNELPSDLQKEHTLHLIRNSDEFKSRLYTIFS